MDLESFITITVVHFFGILSPGPTIIALTRYAINYGMNGVGKFSLGIVIGQFVYLFGAIFGLTKFVFKVYYFKLSFYFLSAIYLLYISFKIFKSKSVSLANELNEDKSNDDDKSKNPLTMAALLTLSNPAAAIFYSSILANFINENSSNFSLFVLMIYLTIATFIFFYLTAFVFSKFKNKVDKYRSILDKIFALMLAYFSIKLFYSSIILVLEKFF